MISGRWPDYQDMALAHVLGSTWTRIFYGLLGHNKMIRWYTFSDTIDSGAWLLGPLFILTLWDNF